MKRKMISYSLLAALTVAAVLPIKHSRAMIVAFGSGHFTWENVRNVAIIQSVAIGLDLLTGERVKVYKQKTSNQTRRSNESTSADSNLARQNSSIRCPETAITIDSNAVEM